MFCLVAVIPQLEGAAIASRVVNVELNNKIPLPDKIKATKEILKDGFFEDPKKFFNRTFYLLHRIFESEKILHDEISLQTSETRKADNVAPCLAAWHHAKSTAVITDKEAKKIIAEYMEYLNKNESISEEYDTFFHVLFNGKLRRDQEDVSISKMLLNYGYYGEQLKAIGIRLDGEFREGMNTGKITAKGSLYISTKSEHIKSIMKKAETYFSNNYTPVLKDHPAYLKCKTVRMPSAFYCCEMDLSKLAEMYFVESGYRVDEPVIDYEKIFKE